MTPSQAPVDLRGGRVRVIGPTPECSLDDSEYEELARICSQEPDCPTTAQELKDEDERDEERLRISALAYDSLGALVGFATLRSWHTNPPDHMGVNVRVDSSRRAEGWGSALLSTIEPLAAREGASMLTASALETEGGAGFMERRGYRETWRALESVLLLNERTRMSEPRPPENGVSIVRYIDEPDTDSRRRRLYDEVSVLTEPDVPGAADGFVWSFEDFQVQIFDRPSARPDQVFVAVAGDRWVGMASVSESQPGRWVNDFTGVVPDWRGKGVARLLKCAVIGSALAEGASEIRTYNDVSNAPMLAVNRTLGYEAVKTWIRLDRRLEAKEAA